jgi:AhpD family alkylhydroperoxidase
MASTPRVPKAPLTGVHGYLLKRFSRKELGVVPEPAEVMWHNRRVVSSIYGLGRRVRRWDELDPHLKSFAHMAVAAQIGCSWCLDYGYFAAHDEGLDEVKASEVPRWRESPVFTRLLDQLGPAAMVELAAIVGFANLTTRCNVSMGIESQELSNACTLPLAHRSTGQVTTA